VALSPLALLVAILLAALLALLVVPLVALLAHLVLSVEVVEEGARRNCRMLRS